MTLGDRICVMQEGRVAQIGPPLEVYRRPANVFVARFLGSPAMNIAPARARLVANDLEVSMGGATLPVSGFAADAVARSAGGGARPILLGLRPENITVVEPSPETPRAVVQAVERLGAETVLTATLEDSEGGQAEVAVRRPRDVRVEPGERIGLLPDPQEIHLFDPDTGTAFARSSS
jgi:ABC-type sugar transport system ATPase subunit